MTTLTKDDRERVTLLEQRQQLRRVLRDHMDRAQSELSRLNEDIVRAEVLFTERMELAAIGSFRELLAAMAAGWRTTAAQARQAGEQPGVPASLDFCAGQIEVLLESVQYVDEPK
jgi:hypothetical protein